MPAPGEFSVAAPQIPAELFSFCMAAIPGPLAGAAFDGTPALELAVLQRDPNASPLLEAAAGLGAGLPNVAILVLDEYVDVEGVPAVGRAENAAGCPAGGVLISARTEVK